MGNPYLFFFSLFLATQDIFWKTGPEPYSVCGFTSPIVWFFVIIKKDRFYSGSERKKRYNTDKRMRRTSCPRKTKSLDINARKEGL
uniref:Uncharacterized protein n=1 Tax=Picea glauca TaxID=3330 RepID=A0A101M5Q4_PICGL|nr:hypothetical protein ABT39_MTgene1147 [Picea glauca]QHR91103.1 hypothetical protein Q903MT_gene5135 [Picea sitchensis]